MQSPDYNYRNASSLPNEKLRKVTAKEDKNDQNQSLISYKYKLNVMSTMLYIIMLLRLTKW